MDMRLPSALLAACLFACGPARQQSAFFSFEGSLQGWTPRGLGLESGGAQEAWTITTVPAVPYDGASSAKFFLDNANGTGKIWLERTFSLSTAGHHVVAPGFRRGRDSRRNLRGPAHRRRFARPAAQCRRAPAGGATPGHRRLAVDALRVRLRD